MPHIDISLYPGRDEEVKQEIAGKLVDFFITELKFPREALSVSFSEFPRETFSEEVAKKINKKDLYVSSAHVN